MWRSGLRKGNRMSVPQLVEEPPEFVFRGGMFYATDPGSGLVRAFRPNTFFATLAGAAKAAREYRLSGAKIVPFRRDAPPEIHAAS